MTPKQKLIKKIQEVYCKLQENDIFPYLKEEILYKKSSKNEEIMISNIFYDKVELTHYLYCQEMSSYTITLQDFKFDTLREIWMQLESTFEENI